MLSKSFLAYTFALPMLVLVSTVHSEDEKEIAFYEKSIFIEISAGTPFAIKLKDESLVFFVVTPDPVFPWRACSISGWKIDSSRVYEELKASVDFPIGPLNVNTIKKAEFHSRVFLAEDLSIPCNFAGTKMELVIADSSSMKICFDQKTVSSVAETHYEGAYLNIDGWKSLGKIEPRWRKAVISTNKN